MKKPSVYFLFALFISFLVCSCENPEEKEHFTAREIAAESAALNQFFEREFQEELAVSPMLQTRLGIKTDYGKWDDFSSEKYTRELERAKERLDFLEDSVEVSALNEQAKLSYILYKQQMEDIVADYDFRFYNYPVNQMFGVQAQIPAFLINFHKITSVEDAKAYISRLNKIPLVFEDVIDGLKLRENNGILPPKFVFDHTIDVSRNILEGKPFEKAAEPSTLLDDFKKKMEKLNISSEEKSKLIRQAQKALVESVKPAYENLIATLEDQRQRATADHGVWKFPKGEEFYENALEKYTTTNLSAQQIHEFGLSEVARIHAEMEEIMEEVGYEGSLQEFFEFMRTDDRFYYENTPEDRKKYLAEATAIIETMKGHLDSLFITRPKAELEVKAVEAFREKSAGKAFYSPPAIDGSRPGIYYANLYDMKAMPIYQMEALAYHEGIPGHHMQIGIAQELDSLPMFRKISSYPAYVEGWGLYAELLPKEIDFYQDPYSDFGRLAMELWRAIRLVVDTGIHSKKWTRQEAIDYYMKNAPGSESAATKMVERHIVWPGQAT
ncbi:MAG TPA: DUF885 domain-containing protein, partial [Salinimicrobium sp.]|nr:DUF885 domain-containing protein [Salinimicrobium sp.]